MPLIQVNLAQGRTKEQKRRLLKRIAEAVHDSIGAPYQSIRVWINEFPKDEFIIGQELMSDRERSDTQ